MGKEKDILDLLVNEEKKYKLGEILLSKLTKEEICLLVTEWDNGTLDVLIRNVILPIDVKNFPDLYPLTNSSMKKGGELNENKS